MSKKHNQELHMAMLKEHLRKKSEMSAETGSFFQDANMY